MSKMLAAPVVYSASTLSREEVERAFPGCIVRPPIARGDLYRDRLLHGSVFVILDGVFHQQRAVSPREIRDVIADGALLIGAASMGALRAAECWPAGMRGIGTIYRLFRAGVFTSDDEVAVSFDPERPGMNASVALSNVRYALWRCLRTHRIDRERAERLLVAAQSLFYAERHWALIIERAGLTSDLALARELAAHDLKRLDALRALRRVRRWSAASAEFFERPRVAASFLVPEERERAYDALDGAPDLRDFALWLVASGRYSRYPVDNGLVKARVDSGKQLAWAAESERWLERHGISDPEPWLLRRLLDGKRLARAARARRNGRRWFERTRVSEEECAQIILAALTVAGELDAELFRYRALLRMATRATQSGLVPSELDRHEAGQRLAFEHDYETWPELLADASGPILDRQLLHAHREQLALTHALKRQEAES